VTSSLLMGMLAIIDTFLIYKIAGTQTVFDKDQNNYNSHISTKTVRTDKAILIIDGAMIEGMKKDNKLGEYLRSLYKSSVIISSIYGGLGKDQHGDTKLRILESSIHTVLLSQIENPKNGII
jgi:hypothetical protein